jgi:ABC-type uncharacterized transport system ATPase subunit
MLVIDGKPMGHDGVNARRNAGAAFVPEERLGHGAVPGFRLSENVILTRHSSDQKLVKSGMVQKGGAAGRERARHQGV